MRIKILRTVGKKDTQPKSADNPASLELPAKKDGTLPKEGEVCEFKDDDAEKYIRVGMAEATDEAVGLPPPPFLGIAPIPVTVVEAPKPATAAAASDDYEAWTVEELHKEAHDRQIEGRSALTTHDALVKAIRKDAAKGKK